MSCAKLLEIDGRNPLKIKSTGISPNTGNSRKHCDLGYV